MSGYYDSFDVAVVGGGHVSVPSVEYEAIRRRTAPESSAAVKRRVDAARELQKCRFAGTGVSCNAYMAAGVCHITGADLGVSVTGVAGPDSDDRGNPVGLVFVALATPDGSFCRRLELGKRRRDRLRDVSSNHAFDMIRRYLTGLDPEAL